MGALDGQVAIMTGGGSGIGERGGADAGRRGRAGGDGGAAQGPDRGGGRRDRAGRAAARWPGRCDLEKPAEARATSRSGR